MSHWCCFLFNSILTTTIYFPIWHQLKFYTQPCLTIYSHTLHFRWIGYNIMIFAISTRSESLHSNVTTGNPEGPKYWLMTSHKNNNPYCSRRHCNLCVAHCMQPRHSADPETQRNLFITINYISKCKQLRNVSILATLFITG